jgi:ABC-type transporter Mla subunit MlaD
MRRALVILGVAALVVSAAVLAGAGGGSHYRVRAIFDTAAFLVENEDVKIAGVRAGRIESLAVTEDKKAAVVLDITEPGFQDFRRDATCTIRPQSLIGEQFVECSPTQPREPGAELPPPLPERDGLRQLPVEQTSASVALDLVGNMSRLPVRQRLTLILNELGAGLAGRGEDLNAVIRRSAPALQELDKVLNLLAEQNETLEQLAVDSDTILEPLARERRRVTGFISSSARVAAATAERREALEASLQRLPRFLAELRPTMSRLGSLADEMTPVVGDLRASAADVDELLRQMGPFSRAATPALVRLGEVGEPGIPALRASLPIVRDLRGFARQVRPVANTLADVLVSFDRNDGLRNLMDYVFFQAMAVNGFDGISHFLRAGLIVNTCSTYAVTPQIECLSKFSGFDARSARAARAQTARMTGFDRVLARTAAVFGGMTPEQAMQLYPEDAAEQQRKATAERRAAEPRERPAGEATPAPADEPGRAAPDPTATPEAPPAATPSPTAPPAATPDPDAAEALLDYLLGKDPQ